MTWVGGSTATTSGRTTLPLSIIMVCGGNTLIVIHRQNLLENDAPVVHRWDLWGDRVYRRPPPESVGEPRFRCPSPGFLKERRVLSPPPESVGEPLPLPITNMLWGTVLIVVHRQHLWENYASVVHHQDF